MFRLKRLYGYLGFNEPLLDSRRTNRCGQEVTDGSGEGEQPVSLTVGEVLSAESGGGFPLLAKLDNTRYIIVYRVASSNALQAYVCSYDSNLTVSKGATVALGTGATSEFTLTSLSDTKVLVVYHRAATNEVFARVLTISDTTISAVGAENTLATTAYSASAGLYYSATSVLLFYRISGGCCFRAVTVTGDTVTVGSQINVTATGSASTSGRSARMSGTLSLIIFSDGDGTKAMAVDFNGTTVTEGVPLVISSWFAGGSDIAVAVQPNSDVAALSTRSSGADLIVTTVTLDGIDVVRDTDVAYVSVDADILNSHDASCIGGGTNAVVFNENVSGTRRPFLETQTFSASGVVLRQELTLLSGLLTQSIHTVRMTNTKLAWCGANSPSGSGPIITQVLHIT